MATPYSTRLSGKALNVQRNMQPIHCAELMKIQVLIVVKVLLINSVRTKQEINGAQNSKDYFTLRTLYLMFLIVIQECNGHLIDKFYTFFQVYRGFNHLLDLSPDWIHS